MKIEIDKTDWKPVKLVDIVAKIEDNDRENAKNRFDRFLKVEHLDAESLHIKRWSSQEKGDEINPTFYKIFRKGQILFPTRNPHLRRTALASFDGICGEKTLTLQPIVDEILPEYLPFLFHSESFYLHSTNSIIGSTNPHCRWRDIAGYEFFLPPKEKQKEISELLWATDENCEKNLELIARIETLIKSVKKAEFEADYESYISLEECGRWLSGGTPSRKNGELWGGSIPWVSPKDMKSELIIDSVEKVTEKAIESGVKIVPEKSILLVVRGLILAHSFPVGLTTVPVTFNQDMKALISSKDYLPEYLLSFLQHSRDKVLSLATTTTHGTKRLASDSLFSLPVPKQSLAKQSQFIDDLEEKKIALSDAIESAAQGKNLLRSIINKVF